MIRTMFGRVYRKITESGFHPYIKLQSILEMDFHFFFGTVQSKKWYDPIGAFSMLEYEWVIKNVDLSRQIIIDGGAHHGHYSVVFGVAGRDSKVISVDPFEMNLALTRVNMCLNHLEPHLIECVIADHDGEMHFENVSNGRIVSDGGIRKVSKTLPTIMPDATIVKLDIEGTEFEVLPSQIDEMKSVHTWIVEVHTKHNNPKQLVNLFIGKGYRVDWVNREKSIVEQYEIDTDFNCHHTTIFARR